MPAVNALIQAAKPAVIFILGAWLLLESRASAIGPARATVSRDAGPGRGRRPLAFAHGVELYYVFNMSSLNEVSCCCCGEGGQCQAAAGGLLFALGSARLGPQVVSNTLFFGGVPLLAVWLLARSRRVRRRPQGTYLAESGGLLVAAGRSCVGRRCWSSPRSSPRC